MYRVSAKLAWGVFASLACIATGATAPAEESQLVLLPAEIHLSSPESRQTLVVQWDQDGQYLEQQREGVSFASSGTNRFRAFDAATGAVLVDRPMPGGVASGAAIANGTVYVGYGVFLDGGPASVGGVQALGLP